MDQNNNEKLLLLNSMEKLIKYLQISKQNQWEIFESLSKNDIQKVINNLQDQDSKIRKFSLTLLGSLLHNNNALRLRLCQRMQIQQLPGKVCLNFPQQVNFNQHKTKMTDLIKLLKQDVKKQDSIFPIWVISLRNQTLKIDFISLSTLIYIDPKDHLIGFNLLEESQQNLKKTFLNLIGSDFETPKKETRKPLFKVTPMTERNSSHSTEFSNRFNRTSQNKTSLGQNMKRSLMVESFQKCQTIPKVQNHSQKQMKFQSLDTSPSKGNNSSIYQDKRFQTNWNHFRVPHSQKIIEKVTPSIINNTNIYINGPISQISVNDSKIQVKRFLQQKSHMKEKNAQINRQKSHKQYQLQEGYILKECFVSGENQCHIFERPFKKYERKTVKEDSVKGGKQFDYQKYREYLKTLNISEKHSNPREPIIPKLQTNN